ncbi:hypothetical protein [Sphingobacterium sp. BIGb0116]|uniref:hypothetical protein n=1 Tax=Sphingobacterium sp. BIGb0116 TaxID=2940619 RepID=UPI002169A222|nr:hypothetical protein [Sphingobacterium sp. BIGb0116]MCS4165253.1 hypothetical protein [Sphingobacterium sp. BIGb0116]
MKYLLTLFLMGLVFFCFAQATNDELLAQAKAQMDNGLHEESINTLNKIHGKTKTKEFVDYFKTVNYFKLLDNGDYPSFEIINKVRSQAALFLKNYSKSRNQGDVKRILDKMDEYPKTQQSYDDTKNRILQEKKTERQQILLTAIRKSYEVQDYAQSLATIKVAKESGYDESPVQYYDFMVKYKLYDQSPSQTYHEVESIVALGNAILSSDHNSLAKLSTAEVEKIKNIVAGLPKSLDEFRKKEEDKRAAAYALAMQRKFDAISDSYNAQEYGKVILATNDFPDRSRDNQKVSYFQAMSRYQLFKREGNYSFSDLLTVKSALEGYITKFNEEDLTSKIEVSAALGDLHKNYPTSQYAYDAMVKREEKKELAAVRRARRKLFTNIGYEYGKLAPIGLRFETGGAFVGFFATVRYGLKSDNQLDSYYSSTRSSQPNKTELIVGPNFKVVDWLLLNIGGGYGVYSHLFRDDYADREGHGKTGYVAGYGGVTLRLSRYVNIIGGASMMAIDKQFSSKKFTQPEFTGGITFNIR